jgi:methylglutaconyl-CoA hydratase
MEILTATEAYVRSEVHKAIATIEFFHPQSNSLPAVILEELAHAIHAAGTDDEIKVVILKSHGPVFCSGASFEEIKGINTEKEGTKFFTGFAHVINAMRKCPKLIIGRIHGKCVGGGVGLAAGVDYAIAVEEAEIKLSELAIGIGPFVVGPAIERKIGLSSFSQLAIDAGMWRNADWARRKGLFAELHTDVTAMDESITRLADTLAHYSTIAVAELKKTLWLGTEHWDQLLAERAAISGKLIMSQHSKEAIANFKSKP